MPIHDQRTIHALPQRVFDCIDDPQRRTQWMRGLVAARYPDGAEHRVGSRFEMDIREGRNVVTYRGQLLAHEPPWHWAVHVGNAYFSMDVDYRLTAVPEGTRLEHSTRLSCHSWLARLMLPLGRLVIAGIIRKQLRALKALAEQG